MPQSTELTLFYQSYAKWLDNGAPHGQPYSRAYGLCSNIKDFPSINSAKLQEELHQQFVEAELNETTPFNEYLMAYENEKAHYACHSNPARIAWVRARATIPQPQESNTAQNPS